MMIYTNDTFEVDAMRKVAAWANLSPDPSTQNAAALHDGVNLLWDTLAVNEFPEGVRYYPDRWDRPIKYSYIEHAERNCIYKAARIGQRTAGMTMICPWAACSDCARGIVQAGIPRLVTLAPKDGDTHDRWEQSIAVALKILEEGGVNVALIQGPLDVTFTIRRDGKPLVL